MDPYQELKDAVNLLADITEAYTVAFFLREHHKKETLRAVAWYTLSKSFRAHATIYEGEGVIGYVAKHLQTVDVDRYQQNSNATKYYDKNEGIKAFIAIPVGEIGVLVVDSKNRPVFGEREKKIIHNFATFIHHIVLHQDTYFREAMYGRILDLLYEIENASLNYTNLKDYYTQILDIGKRYTNLSMGFLLLLHSNNRNFRIEAVEGASLNSLQGRSYSIYQGIVGWLIREKRALTHSKLNPLPGKSYLIAPDEPMRNYNAFVGVPLLAWRRLIGVLAFAGRTDRTINKEEERALQLAGHRVAATIEHYRLEK